ncbi:hypothetical protein pipiens_001260 [Culex pipiens pipiens]|uniref:E3 ubiquitin-protein ligase listerin N-terminal domain-containing protein n=1 Tax=Culex pipiens pipiens TaxID=38569 RepID=A0ABD1D8G0_CULPP
MLGSTVPTLFGFTTLDSSKYRVLTRTGKYELDVVKAVLTFWPRLYGNLSTDEEHRVRETAQQAQVAVIAKAGKNTAPYLKYQQQQDDQEESKNRETESPMTLEYNSDYELNEGDMLRMEDSDEDQESKREDTKNWHHNFKKLSRIIDSDSDEADRTVTTPRNLIAESGSDSDQLAKQNQAIDAIGNEVDKTMSRLKSLVDSDSSSGKEQNSVEVGVERKRKKKLKTKKERYQAKEKKKDPKDLLASFNRDFSDDSRSKASSSGGSDSESRSGAARNVRQGRRALAREASVSTPYHKPKQRTLEEFLNRRTVQNPLEFPVDGRQSQAAAIRMPPEQLEAFAKYLEEREKETIEFFKGENVQMEPAEEPVETTRSASLGT